MYTPSLAARRVAKNSKRPATRPGRETISLASGDPDFETPEFIRQAHRQALDEGYTHYAHNQGDPELRSALAERLTMRSVRPVRTSDIVITHGGSGAISAALLATIDPGDRVLIPEPTYSLYADILELIGATPILVPPMPDFHLDLDRIERLAADAKMVILCNPCNPTGVVFRRDELERLGQLSQQYGFLVFCDEAYDHIVFDETSFTSTLGIETLADRLIYCQTFSKTYAMTGWRIGYLATVPDIADESVRIHRTLNGAMNSAVQRAALAAVTTSSDYPERMRREYQYRRELALEFLESAPGYEVLPPEGTFYAFIRSTSGLTSRELVDAAQERGVAIRAGTEYGPSGEGWFRITFATGRDALSEGMRRLRELGAVSAD